MMSSFNKSKKRSHSAKNHPWSFSLSPGTLFALIYFLAPLPWLGKNRLLGLDESTYADIALAEVRDHHWFPLYFQGHPFWDKPPLLLWLQGLGVELWGPREFSLRIFSAVAGALCIYFVYQLGTVLGKSRWAGVVCVLLMGFQEHFILYSRIANLDMPLVCCLLGAWWQVTKTLNSADQNPARKDLLLAGLWMAAAVWIKSWFGLILLPAAGLAIFLRRSFPFSHVMIRLVLPPLVSILVWINFCGLYFGKPYWDWALGFDLSQRFHNGGFSSLANAQYHWRFYAVLTQDGLAFLWPFLPLCFLLWIRTIFDRLQRRSSNRTDVIGPSFFFYYLFFILVFIATLINYLLPLVPAAALSAALLIRFRDDVRVAAAGSLAALLGALNGFSGFQCAAEVFWVSWGLCVFLIFPRGWGLWKGWLTAALTVAIIASAWNAQAYWQNPPDPNRVWVAAVLTYPARYHREPLLFVGEHTDARVLEFYSDYQVIPISGKPLKRPAEALLFQYGNEAVYFPALKAAPQTSLNSSKNPLQK